MSSKNVASMAALVLVLLGGCAQTETRQDSAQNNGDAIHSTTSSNAGTPSLQQSNAANKSALNKSAVDNPAVVEFESKGTTLNDNARALLAQLSDTASQAHQIVVTGYCDRREGAHAKEIALSRATAVKNELVKNGVPAKIIRIKYITAQPRNAAVIAVAEK